jgi:23S rRNA (cytidine1920-2'-O)/16S rRNA (cytidine1409-2'-O)-methyltransferase
MAEPLRDDARVVVLDGVNARALTTDDIPQAIDLIVCDVSFIGLEVVLPNALGLAAPGAHLVALIKPQFEVGPDRVGRGGIVRDPELHTEVCERINGWLGAQGWEVLGVTPSPLDGAKGNKEFLIAARRS